LMKEKNDQPPNQ